MGVATAGSTLGIIHFICGMVFLMVLHEECFFSSSPSGGRFSEESMLLRNPTTDPACVLE